MNRSPIEIAGRRVVLRSTTEADLGFLKGLWNDGRVMQWVGFPQGSGYTDESIAVWFQRLCGQSHLSHFIAWANHGTPCGEIGYRVEPGTSRAGLDIKFVPEQQGKGLAADALTALIDHVFNTEQGVEEVWTEPHEDNAAARRLYARCGLRAKARPSDMEPAESYWALERHRWQEMSGQATDSGPRGIQLPQGLPPDAMDQPGSHLTRRI
jgi:RimJ/RimL family protein N-acetyltransferase